MEIMFDNENSLNDSKGEIECNYTEMVFKSLKIHKSSFQTKICDN
jgi:hypothetical protein